MAKSHLNEGALSTPFLVAVPATRSRILEPKTVKCSPHFLPSQVWPPAQSLRCSWPNASLCSSDWADDFCVICHLHPLCPGFGSTHPTRGVAAQVWRLPVSSGRPRVGRNSGDRPIGRWLPLGLCWVCSLQAEGGLRADSL